MLTPRMRLILIEIGRRNKDGSLLDLDQIIDRVEYSVTKEAIQFTLRFMIKKGVIEKGNKEIRRSRNRVTYKLTALGQDFYKFEYQVPSC